MIEKRGLLPFGPEKPLVLLEKIGGPLLALSLLKVTTVRNGSPGAWSSGAGDRSETTRFNLLERTMSEIEIATRIQTPARVPKQGGQAGAGICHMDDSMAELAILLPSIQEMLLERLAGCRGMTVGQLVRSLIQEYLSGDRHAMAPALLRAR